MAEIEAIPAIAKRTVTSSSRLWTLLLSPSFVATKVLFFDSSSALSICFSDSDGLPRLVVYEVVILFSHRKGRLAEQLENYSRSSPGIRGIPNGAGDYVLPPSWTALPKGLVRSRRRLGNGWNLIHLYTVYCYPSVIAMGRTVQRYY